MSGRGAWNNAGVGGTINYRRDKPGPYYAFPVAGGPPQVGSPNWKSSSDINVRAVRGGVLAIQRACNRRLDHEVSIIGVFSPDTRDAVARFQTEQMKGQAPWGGVGPETAQALFTPDLIRQCQRRDFAHWEVVCGLVKHESSFDPGAVGFVDEDDLGLAQINGRAHPEWDEKERLKPVLAFDFVIDYLTAALVSFEGEMDDAIASYNLGGGGARSWIRAGRPDMWTPAGSTSARNVRRYIDGIKGGCAA